MPCCNAESLIWHYTDGDILCRNCGLVHSRILDDYVPSYADIQAEELAPVAPPIKETPNALYADPTRGFTADHFHVPNHRKFWKHAADAPRDPSTIIKRMVYEYDEISHDDKWPVIKRALHIWEDCPAVVKQSCKLNKLCVRILWAAQPPKVTKKEFCAHFKVSSSLLAKPLL
jgi:hypothetical protein